MLQFLLNPTILLLVVQAIFLSLVFLLFAVRNVLLSVLLLVCLFLTVGFCFIFMDALYLSLVFIIVYIGAIAVLFLFVIMLTNKIYTRSYSYFRTISSLVGVVLVVDIVFASYLNVLTGDVFWFLLNFSNQVFGDFRLRFFINNDPLVVLGFHFFNYYSFYLLGLGLLLVVVLVGIVLVLRNALGNTLLVYRVVDVEQLRWQRLLQFRDFVRLKR